MRSVPEINTDLILSAPMAELATLTESLRVMGRDDGRDEGVKALARFLHDGLTALTRRAYEEIPGLAYTQARAEMALADEADRAVSDFAQHMEAALNPVVSFDTFKQRLVHKRLARCPEVTGPGSAA